MTWNISFSLVTGVLLCILLGYYVAYPRLPVVSNRLFILLALSEMCTLASDIIATLMDMNHQSFPVWVLFLVNLIYFLFFTLRSFVLYVYTVTLASQHTRLQRGYYYVGFAFGVLFALLSISSVFTGFIFTIDKEGYHSGPGYAVINAQLFVFLILGLWMIVRFWKSLPGTLLSGILLVYAILISGGIFRTLLPDYLLMDTFFMMSIVILYITIHNADLYRESRTMSFDYQAFELVVRDHHNYGVWYQLIGVMTNNYEEARQIYGGVQIDVVLNRIGRYLREQFRGATVFYERSGCFLIMIEERQTAEKAVSMILPEVIRRFREPWDGGSGSRVFLNAVFSQMNSDLEIPSVDLEIEVVRRLLGKGGNGELDHDFVVDRTLVDEVIREFEIKKALSYALQKNDLQIFMQPIIDARTGKVVGAEALSRLIDPKLGLIPPVEFIPLAERSGSIIEIGEQVLAKTCRFLVERRSELQGIDFININLSPIQCMDPDLADTFDLVPKTYGVDTKMLHLEITEESMVDPDVLKSRMEVLGKLGYVFSLDDYGSGYANQFRIKTFPFSGIKLDMKIVWAHFREPDSILPNAVSSFLDCGLTVTAEGVETGEMVQQLREMGCTYLQGFYYSKPLPLDEFIEYLKKRAS